MWTYVIVKGFTEDTPGIWGDSQQKEYTCYVSFSSIRDIQNLTKDYFLYYHGFNYDELQVYKRPPMDDYNTVCAILTYYFRDQSLKFKYKEHSFSHPKKFPERKPDKEENNYRVWIDTESDKKITTSKSAAWMLYNVVSNGKLSVDDAKFLIKEKFPEQLYKWKEILYEFSKLGGAYTDKYLRRR